VISGRNGRRLSGALQVARGERIRVVRERRRQEEGLALLEARGQVRPDRPTRLIWDQAPPHHPKRVRAAATAAHVTIAWLPFRSPALTPREDLWRRRKAVGAAHRVYAVMAAVADHAVAWRDRLPAAEVLHTCGLLGSRANLQKVGQAISA
jgi:hypothetical protein